MNLRKRTLLSILAATAMIMMVGGVLAHTTFLNSYKELEQADIQRSVNRLDSTLKSELVNLSTLTVDWAAWDDTYQFMQDNNTSYLESNLVDGTFEGLKLNLIMYFDNNGNIFYQKAYDLENSQVTTVPSEVMDLINKNPDLLDLKEDEIVNSFLSVKDQPMIYCLSPILTSLEEGPSQGVLLFAKFIDSDLLKRIMASTESDLVILPYKEQNLPLKDGLILNTMANQARIYIQEVDSQTIEYYSFIKDFNEEPIFIIKQTAKRPVYQQGLISVKNLMLAIMLTSVTAGVFLIFTLEKHLLSRLSTLHDSVAAYRLNSKKDIPIRLSGKDELSSLSIEIDETLQSLIETQQKLNGYLDYEKFVVNISTKLINLPINKIDQNIQSVLEAVGNYFEADSAHILIFHEKDIEIEKFYEWHLTNIASIKEVFQNLDMNSFKWSQKKLQKGESIILANPEELPPSAKAEKTFIDENQINSIICFPLKVTGEVLGLLSLELVNRDKQWDEQTPLSLEIISNIIANTVDRKRNELRLQQNQQFQYRLNQITKTSIEKDSSNASIRALSRLLKTLIGSDRGLLILTRSEQPIEIYDSGRKIPWDPNMEALISHLLERTVKTFYIYDSSISLENKNPNYYELLGQTFIAIPLIGKNQRLGLVILAYNQPRNFSLQELGICQQAATQITLSIIKIQSLEESREISKELRNLRSTIAEISSELELIKLQSTILERAVKLIKGEGGIFYKYDEQANELEIITCLNLDRTFQGDRIKFGEGAAGKALQLGKTIYIKDYSIWKNSLEAYRKCGLKSTIATPLMIGSKPLGCITVFHYNSSILFSKNDQHLLTIFAQHASISIDNALLFEKVQKIARMDEVTGLLNRRALNEVGQYELDRSVRLNRPIAVAMVDLDNYKEINDTHNHIIGDKVLREIARIFRENVRNIDIVARYGGDECVIIMPETDIENAYIAIERIRSILEEETIYVDDLEFNVTACFGISVHMDHPPDLEKIIEEADTAMYAAKDGGRNCIRVFQKL